MLKITLQLQPRTVKRYRSVFAAIPELTIEEGFDVSIAVGDQHRPVQVLPRPPAAEDSAVPAEHLLDTAARHLANDVPAGTVGLVVSRSIPQRDRDALERTGLSWCDGRGAIHLSWPGTLVHVDHTGRRRAASDTATGESPRLGPAGLRAVQVLLAGDTDRWTITLLAEHASISVGQAHTVFRTMEEQRLVVSIGRGPKQHRIVTDRAAALDWLAEIDGARRRPQIARAYLYGRTDLQVAQRFAERAVAGNVPYALTGAAASHMLGASVLSRIAVTQIRVAGAHFEESLARLGFADKRDEGTSNGGANLELWSDTGQLGTFGATTAEDVCIAPPIRIWLDLRRQGGRSRDAADLFREHVVDRT
jgi:hypothetical protein